ncbi:extracellular solute-binding protein [Paenibacillus sp. H1-7]|uniref:ABC transporter substrate-binding protein n=1 Tax=Paenibacillus sp. H1-7 TaxID=2282849 RepID=UPI001EF7DB69|nr:extracellular solute-binding protein [Paenibacillus sp. H1-7]ULL16257.1 extracellular solute-binding protein [Paenibacillus sp. H1-7]
MNKVISTAISCTLLIPLLAACSSSSTTSTDKAPAETAADLNKVDNEPVTLTFKSDFPDDMDVFNQYYGDRIKQKFPNVTINFIPRTTGQTLQDLLNAGTYPDIMYGKTNGVDGFIIETGLAYDMSELVKKYNYDLSRFKPQLIDAIRNTNPDGQLFGLPMPDFDPQVLYYNKSIFDRFGVPYPKDGMTWDEVYDLAQKLTRVDGGKVYRGFSMQQGVIMRDNQLGIPYLDPKADKMYNDEAWKKQFENLARFYQITNNNRDTKNRSAGVESDAFIKGDVAMQVNQLTKFRTFPEGLEWDMVTIPTFKEKPNTMNQSSSAYWFITNTNKNKDISFKIIAYLLSDEVQTDYATNLAGLPSIKAMDKAVKTFGQNVPALKGKHVEAAYKYDLAPASPQRDKGLVKADPNKVASAINNAFLKVVIDGVDINTALRQAGEDITKAIDEKRTK